MLAKPQVKEHFYVLDAIRGIAALMVMLYHYNLAYHYKLQFNTYLAVDIFFILSGFVISHSYAEKLRQGMTTTAYIIRRLARLFPFAAIGTLLGLVALLIMYQQGQTDYTLIDVFTATFTNFLLLPTLINHYVTVSNAQAAGLIFPGNSPLWSIFFETIASIAFIFLLRVSKSGLLATMQCCIIALLLMPLALGTANLQRFVNIDGGWSADTLIVGFPRVIYGFALGMLLYQLRGVRRLQPKGFSSLRAACFNPLVICVLLVGVLAFPYTLKGVYGLVVIVCLAPAIVYLGSQSTTENPSAKKAMTFLGWLSFPIYCVHEPILTITNLLMNETSLFHSLHVFPGVLAGIVSIAFAIGFATLFDHMGLQNRIVKALEKLVLRRNDPVRIQSQSDYITQLKKPMTSGNSVNKL